MVPVRLLLLAAAALALVAAPAVPAEQAVALPSSTEVALRAPDEPIRPLAGVAVLEGEVRYTVSPAVRPLAPTRIALEVDERPAWAVVSLSPDEVVLPADGFALDVATTATFVASFQVLVATTMDAPAFAPAAVRVVARAEASPPFGASEGADVAVVVADYVGLLRVEPATREVPLAPGGAATLPLRVANAGNGATRVTLEVAENAAGLEVELPEPFALESRQDGGRHVAREVEVGLRAPRGFSEPADLVLRVAPAYALDVAREGKPALVALRVVPLDDGVALQSFTGDGGASSLPLALGVLGGAAGAVVGARRARR